MTVFLFAIVFFFLFIIVVQCIILNKLKKEKEDLEEFFDRLGKPENKNL